MLLGAWPECLFTVPCSQSEGIMLAAAVAALLHRHSVWLSSLFTSIIQHLEYCLIRAATG